MATRRYKRNNKRHTRRYKRGGSNTKTKLNRAKALHMAFGKQRAFAFASH